MDVQAPSPQTTLLILLGASGWPFSSEFQSSEAFANAARRLRAYFLNPRPFGLPAENLLDLFDTDQSADELDVTIGQFLQQRVAGLRAGGNPARDLLLYFVGHGGFVGRDSDFYLAIRRTRMDNPRASGLQMMSLADTLTERARHLRRIIILDCCFAAAAFSAFQSGPAQVAMEKTVDAFEVRQKAVGFPAKGTTLLCSSSHKSPSLLLPDGSSTMFTKALLDALVQGTTSQRDHLTLRDVKDAAADLLSEIRNAPKPVVLSPDQSEGDVADIPFFPNTRIKREQLRRIEEERRRAEEEQARREEEERWRRVEEERARQAEKAVQFRDAQESVRTIEEQAPLTVPAIESPPVSTEKSLPIEEKSFPVSEPPIVTAEASVLAPIKRADSVPSSPSLSGSVSFQPVTRLIPGTPPSTGTNIDGSAKAIQSHRIFALIITPLIFGALTCLFVLPLISSGKAYIRPPGLWPVAIIIIIVAAAQGVGVYYAGSKIWVLATVGGFFLFLLIGCFAVFGPISTLVLLVVLLIISVVLMRLYFYPVAEGHVDIVYAFGKYSRTLYPGLNILLPWEKVTYQLNAGEKQWACPLQKVQLSRDEDVVLRATISYQLMPEDAYIAVTQVDQWENSLKNYVLATIQSIATTFTPEDFIAWPQDPHSFEQVNAYLFQLIRDRVALWGVQVNWVRILDVSLAPPDATIILPAHPDVLIE